MKYKLNKDDLIEQITDVFEDEPLEYVLKIYKTVCNPEAKLIKGELGTHIEVNYDE